MKFSKNTNWRCKKTLLYSLLSISLISNYNLRAAPVASLDPGKTEDKLLLSNYLTYIEDKNGSYNFEKIKSINEISFSKFKDTNTDINLGFSSSVFWLRFELENLSDQKLDRMLEFAYTRISYLTVYIPSDGTYKEINTGNNLAFNTRPYSHRNFIFPIQIPSRSKQVYFLKIQTSSPVIMPVRLWSPVAFHRYERDDYFNQAVYFGIATAMILFNLLLLFSLKDIIYFYYVTFAITMFYSISTKNGLAKEYLWFDSEILSNNSSLTANALTFITFMLFFRLLLKTYKFTPKADLFVKSAIAIHSLLLLGLFISYSTFSRISMIINILTLVLVMGIGIYYAFNKHRSGYVFLIAFIVLFITATLASLTSLGFFQATVITKDILQIGSMAEMILLAFALADRFNVMRQDKEKAQALLLEQEHQSLQLMIKAKEELEEKVVERTKELSTAKDLAEKATKQKDRFVSLVSHDLKGPIGAIWGLFSIYHDEELSNEKMREYSELGKNSAAGLLEMIDKLLDISRLQTGAIVIDKIEFQVKPLVNEIIERLIHHANLKRIHIRNLLPDSLTKQGDRTLIGEVIANLISNAIKFSDYDSSITIGSDEDDSIFVEDSGKGIPETILPNLFKSDIKTSLQGTAGEKGTGLGLPLSFDIMSAHGGILTAVTGPHGSKFFMNF